jgi:hypothetical protein
VLLALTAARNPAGATCISPSGRDTSSVNDLCSKLATMSNSSNQNDVRAKYWTLLSEHARNKIASTGKSERRALLELLLEVILATFSKTTAYRPSETVCMSRAWRALNVNRKL